VFSFLVWIDPIYLFWNIAKRLHWIPQSISREAAYYLLNEQVPSHLKFTLHVLLVQHGKLCPICSKTKKKKTKRKFSKQISSADDDRPSLNGENEQ